MNKHQQEICQYIYEEQKQSIYWYLRTHFGWLGDEDVHDVMSEVWLAMCQNVDRLSQLDEIAQRKYLFRVAHNQAVNFQRYDERNKSLMEKIDQDTVTFPIYSDSVENMAMERISAQSVIDKLTQKDKKVLFRHYLSLSNLESKTTKSNADICKDYRVRQKLVKMMREGGLDEY